MIRFIVHMPDGSYFAGRAQDQAHVSIPQNGKFVTVGETAEVPHPSGYVYNADTGAFVAKASAPTVSDKWASHQRYRSMITAGVVSDALGFGRTYATDEQSQHNLLQSAAVGGDLWCTDGKTWALLPHTAAQATQVLKDFVRMRDIARRALASLKQ